MLDRWISFALIAAVVSSILSIVVSEVFFGVAILLWLADCWKSRTFRLKSPPFTPFLLAFFAGVLMAIAFSSDVLASAPYLKKFIKFLYIFLIFTYLSRAQVELALKGMFGILGGSAVLGAVQYFWLWEVHLLNRIDGFMGHWMTFSGQLMLVAVALAGYLFLYQLPSAKTGEKRENWSRERILPIAASGGLLALFLFVLILTQTRNALLGTLAGLLLILWVYRIRWVMGGMVLLVVVFFALPAGFKERLYSSFDPNDTTTRIRIELFLTGKNMIVAHPWTGLGPSMVSRHYEDYNETDEFPTWIYQHLHNNFLHIAAEMGVITLLIWIALWVRLCWDFIHFVRDQGSDRFVSCMAMTGVAVVAAFLLAGLFEYNFGDSEILILLLFFITIPYVLHDEQEKGA